MLHTVRPRSGPVQRQIRHRLRAAALVSALGSLGVLLAACSSGSANAAGSGTSTTVGGSTAASFAAYEACLKSHGVTFTLGGFRPGAGGTASPPSSGATTRTTLSPSERTTFDKANTACASLRPKFNGTGAGSTAFAAYRNCLKLHGVTLPAGRGGPGFGGGSSTSTTSSPKVQAALTACAALRPKGGFGRGFPGSSTTTTS
jgi:hypothetical protein